MLVVMFTSLDHLLIPLGILKKNVEKSAESKNNHPAANSARRGRYGGEELRHVKTIGISRGNPPPRCISGTRKCVKDKL